VSRARARVARLFLVVVAAAAAAGCSTRDHLNPLDPENPATGGEPRWLSAVADRGAVDLAWSVPAYRDLETVIVLDLTAGDTLAAGAPGDGSVRRAPVPDGVERRFRLDLALTGGRVLSLPEEIATPGPAVVWVYDVGPEAVIRMAPDGRETRFRIDDPSGLTVAADPDSGSVLAVDFYAGRVSLFDREGRLRWSDESFSRPIYAVHAAEGWWVADPGDGTVTLLDPAGAVLYADSTFVTPVDLAPAGPGAVWVADRSGRVGRLRRGEGTVDSTTAYAAPYLVSETADGGVWVADHQSEALVRLDASLVERARVKGLPGLNDLASDPVDGVAVWGADRGGRRVVRFAADGSAAASLAGVISPSALVVSPDGSEIWVTDPSRGELIRLARDGSVIARSRGLGVPTALAVAFDPAP
jgi:DNA-binding beta-propeller fold protein YncE